MQIDLNKLTKYTKFIDGVEFEEQWEKVKEEFKEVKDEYCNFLEYGYKIMDGLGTDEQYEENMKKLKGELLDLITASYNWLDLMNIKESDINEHCQKLDTYLSKGGKYEDKNN